MDTGVSVTATAVGNGWYRLDATFTPTGAVGAIGVGVLSGGTSDISLDWGAVANGGAYFWYPAPVLPLWSKTAGQTNVYQTQQPIDWMAGETYVSVWENDVRLVRADSIARIRART
jgi:hypothetical protein